MQTGWELRILRTTEICEDKDHLIKFLLITKHNYVEAEGVHRHACTHTLYIYIYIYNKCTHYVHTHT
jgi:hypothetical protein